MTWQDFALSSVGSLLLWSLWPLIRRPEARVPRSASLTALVCVVIVTGAHLSLRLWWTAGTSAMLVLAWAFIARYRAQITNVAVPRSGPTSSTSD